MKEFWHQLPFRVALAACLALASVAGAADDSKGDKPQKAFTKELSVPAVFTKPAPEGPADLRAMQAHVVALVEKVKPAVVGLRIGRAAGSGVIVSEDGYVLTAGHVSDKPDRDAIIILPDGKELKGKTLGHNEGIDSGMIKITDKGKWSWVEMGQSSKVKVGQWCLAIGHPGAYRPGRDPVVRLGRVSTIDSSLIRTDNTLVGGDSGGPLFDMQGKVIGIHSRIGPSIADNIHVPVDTYRETWDRLAASEEFGGFFERFRRGAPYLGIQVEPDSKNCKIAEINKDSPAEKGGLKVDDVITKIGGKVVHTFDDLSKVIAAKKAGDEVAVEVLRGDDTVKLKIKLGKRPG